jgi:hypothetical protein
VAEDSDLYTTDNHHRLQSVAVAASGSPGWPKLQFPTEAGHKPAAAPEAALPSRPFIASRFNINTGNAFQRHDTKPAQATFIIVLHMALSSADQIS